MYEHRYQRWFHAYWNLKRWYIEAIHKPGKYQLDTLFKVIRKLDEIRKVIEEEIFLKTNKYY